MKLSKGVGILSKLCFKVCIIPVHPLENWDCNPSGTFESIRLGMRKAPRVILKIYNNMEIIKLESVMDKDLV